jgi:hypothetical protein
MKFNFIEMNGSGGFITIRSSLARFMLPEKQNGVILLL